MSEQLARKFHKIYERLAPNFGYETRKETRAFDATTPNGKLMIAVTDEIEKEYAELERKLGLSEARARAWHEERDAIWTSAEVRISDLKYLLTTYREGFDPKVKVPVPLSIEWKGYPVYVINNVTGYTHICDGYSPEYGFRETQGEVARFTPVADVLRWWPVPGSKGGEV